MPHTRSSDPYYGVFRILPGHSRLNRQATAPATIPDPQTGRALRIATVEEAGAICPACEQRGDGGFVSFVADLRLVFACPHCREFVWINGA